MISALLNEQIAIEVETTSKNGVGTPIETYVHLKYTYASVKYTKGDTEFREAAMPYTDTEFSVRYDSRLNYKCRVLFNGEYYKILHIEKIGRKDGLRLKTIKWDE